MLAQFFSSDQPQSAPNPSVLHSYAYKKRSRTSQLGSSKSNCYVFFDDNTLGRAFCLQLCLEIIAQKDIYHVHNGIYGILNIQKKENPFLSSLITSLLYPKNTVVTACWGHYPSKCANCSQALYFFYIKIRRYFTAAADQIK